MVTVVIISYRYGHLVAQAIESALSQTVPCKVVVIDDGVGDCEHVPSLYPVEFIARPKRLGMDESLNDALFNHVKTEKVMFLGADNWLRADAVELMTTDADITSCDVYLFGELAKEFGVDHGCRFEDGHYRWELPYQPHGGALYNVKLAKAVGGYGKGRQLDSQLFSKMIEAGATFERVPLPLFYWRKHKENYNEYTVCN